MEIDPLLIDVVMPRMDGRRLVDSLRKSRPLLRVLFISGYSDEVFDAEYQKAWDEPFLPKPFSVQGISEKVREVLDQPKGAHPSGRPSWLLGS